MGGTLKFTIITPTLQRPSLYGTCMSVDTQRGDWEHLVMVDSGALDLKLMDSCYHPQRQFRICGTHHNNGGNTCRHLALDFATGDYVIYLDDDNFLAENILPEIALALETAGEPEWGIFPINRLGSIFFSDPPRSCHTDTLNLVLKRRNARWPLTDAYGSDGVLIEQLKECGVPWVAFPNFRPIGTVPMISFCK